MTIKDYLYTDLTGLAEEQVNQLRLEYDTIENEIKSLKNDKHNLEERIEQVNKKRDDIISSAVSCINTVEAMLKHSNSGGATHRMRNFYAEAIIEYIKNVKTSLEVLKCQTNYDEYPF